MKSRIFNIMQYEFHPETGEPLLNEERIRLALSHKTIGRYAYIAHDNDVYSAADELNDATHTQGKKKPKHWHIVIEMKSNQVEVGVIAKWLGIADNFIDCAKGAGAFLDCVTYLTHEDLKQQAAGKRLYEDEKVVANFPFRAELDRRAANKLKYGKDLTDKERWRYDVMYNGKTLRQCIEENKLAYLEDMEKLKKCRMAYIESLKPPRTRLNYYICGRGGLGKGLLSRALARSLYPHLKEDSDIFFEVGSKGVAFDGYDGQPVLIWNDRRAIDLLHELGDRGNVFNVFDTHPTAQKQNIKYGTVNLSNEVNIVNSVQPYLEFLDGLAQEYKRKDGQTEQSEDKGQSYRRFPFIIPLHEKDFDMLLNRGFMENTNNYQEYIEYLNIIGNMERIATMCKGNEQLRLELEAKTVKPIADKHHEIKAKFDDEEAVDEDEIRALLSDFGTTVDKKKSSKIEETTATICDVEYKEITTNSLKPHKPSNETIEKAVALGWMTKEQADAMRRKYQNEN